MPTNILAEYQTEELLKNWKLTPATLIHKLANRGLSGHTTPPWDLEAYLGHISLKVATGIARGNARIIVSLPPRHGKSTLIDIGGSAWILENFPSFNVVLASYGSELSTEFSRKTRDLIRDNSDLLDTRIRSDVDRIANFVTTGGGGVLAVGLGGPITGRGANVLIIDDYIKEIKEAMSKTYRDYVWNWFVTTAMTRLEPNASVIIIATRWHRDDLIGRILRNDPEDWDYIKIPALCEVPQGETDEFGREPGQPLSRRYGLDYMHKQKRLLGTHWFNAIYQQNPESDASGLMTSDWLKIVDDMPISTRLRCARIWDLAASSGGGDYTCGTKMWYDPLTEFCYVSDVKRAQLSSKNVEKLVKETAISDGHGIPIYIEQEPGSAGKALISHYENDVLADYNIEGIPTTNAKEVRAQPMLAAAEAGEICLIRAPWNIDVTDEFDAGFDGEYNDILDTLAIGYMKLADIQNLSPVWGRKPRNEGVTSRGEGGALITGATFGKRRGRPSRNRQFDDNVNDNSGGRGRLLHIVK